MHKKYNTQIKYNRSVPWTACVVNHNLWFLLKMYALLNSDWRLTQALEWKILISEVAKCLVKVPRSRLTSTQGGWERRTPMGIWWETEHIMLTRSSSGVGIAMWRGSTQMVGEPVWSQILSLGSTGRLQMGKKEGWLASRGLRKDL